MFEVWASQIDPGLWMIVAGPGSIPADQPQTDWSLLGRCAVSKALAADVQRKGHAAVRSSRPFDASAVLDEPPAST